MARRGRKRAEQASPLPGWADRLREAREALGLSQERLGNLAGFDSGQSAVTRWETGVSPPDLATFIRLGEILKVFPAWLAFGISPEGKPDNRDPLATALVERHKNNRLFARTFIEAARMMAEEGMDADLAFLAEYARKVSGVANRSRDDAEARELITREIEKDRLKVRRDLEESRNKLL